MHFFYELKEDRMEIYEKASVHYPPHIHKSIECIYVTEGTLELGIGETLYHMETGDFGIVFPKSSITIRCSDRRIPALFTSWRLRLSQAFILTASSPSSRKIRSFRPVRFTLIFLMP